MTKPRWKGMMTTTRIWVWVVRMAAWMAAMRARTGTAARTWETERAGTTCQTCRTSPITFQTSIYLDRVSPDMLSLFVDNLMKNRLGHAVWNYHYLKFQCHYSTDWIFYSCIFPWIDNCLWWLTGITLKSTTKGWLSNVHIMVSIKVGCQLIVSLKVGCPCNGVTIGWLSISWCC